MGVFKTGGEAAMLSFLDLHPDKKMLLSVYGTPEIQEVAEAPKPHLQKEQSITFSVKECLLGLSIFFLLLLFLKK